MGISMEWSAISGPTAGRALLVGGPIHFWKAGTGTNLRWCFFSLVRRFKRAHVDLQTERLAGPANLPAWSTSV